MEVDITAAPAGIVIGASGLEEIIQNVRTIIATARGTVPLDRDFGVSAALVDDPTPSAMARFSSDIVDAVETYEPRVKVVGISWRDSDALDGKLQPAIRIKIREGVIL